MWKKNNNKILRRNWNVSESLGMKMVPLPFCCYWHCQHRAVSSLRSICRFNWGLNVRKKADRILKLLEEGPLLKEERDRARKLSRGIQGFGSFCQRSASSSSSSKSYSRCNSDFISHENQDNHTSETGSQDKEELHLWNFKGESNPLVDCSKEESRHGIFREEDDHPFSLTDKHASEGILQGCWSNIEIWMQLTRCLIILFHFSCMWVSFVVPTRTVAFMDNGLCIYYFNGKQRADMHRWSILTHFCK